MACLQTEELKRYNLLYREMDQFYHRLAVKSGLSDSAFWIFYAICEIGDGCLQKDICNVFAVSKQTIHSAICKLEKEGFLYLEQGKGRDKHIYLTDMGQQFIQKTILPVIEMENAAFLAMGEQERMQMLKLTEEYLRFLEMEYEKRK